MRTNIIFFLIAIIFGLSLFFGNTKASHTQSVLSQTQEQKSYWFVLHRASNREELLLGIPGEKNNSIVVKEFRVKTGVPFERPTPLPQILGRKYWLIVNKHEERENPETAPYFLTLDIPTPSEEPYGPSPYLECNGQCNWNLPGSFGLHGVGGDISRLDESNAGSSGCVRHSDEDIIYLYTLLEPQRNPVRYYIEDN